MVLLLVGWKMEVISEFILCLIQVQQNQFYTKDFMKELPSCLHIQNTKITPRSIKIADNNLINVTECIKFPVSFAGHHFEFIAFLVDIIDDFDFVIGSKSMFELEADMKYSNLTFEFAKRSIRLIPTRSYTCPTTSMQKY